MKYLLIFAAGLAVDLLIAWYTLAVSRGLACQAAFYAVGITLVNFVFLAVILKGNLQGSIAGIVVYAAGNGLGTYLAFNPFRKDKDTWIS